MALYWLELKKICSSVGIYIFVIACLLFNIYLSIQESGDEYANFVGDVSVTTGVTLGPSFQEEVSKLAVRKEQVDHLEWLKSDTLDVSDVFDGYETKGIGESYINATGSTGNLAESMRKKYAALQKVVDKRAANNESLTLYFASATYQQHKQLFGGMVGCLLIEGGIISVLLALLSVGYENNQKTEDVIYSTKVGRRIVRSKIAATVSAVLAIYALLALVTFGFYFTINKYGNVWESSISSVFNYRFDVFTGNRPFITWHSFRVDTYFMATLGMSVAVILCFSLMAFGMGLFIRNHYIAFLIFILAHATAVALPMQMPQNSAGLYVKYGSMLTPTWLWLKQSIWFTDGDVDILWPHFETVGICISFLALIIFLIFATTYYRKRDMT